MLNCQDDKTYIRIVAVYLFKETAFSCTAQVTTRISRAPTQYPPAVITLLINPLPVQFKSLLHGQEGCVFFSGHLNLCMCQFV
jgi:hypothetical protein